MGNPPLRQVGEGWDVGKNDWVGDGEYAVRRWILPELAWDQTESTKNEIIEVRQYQGHRALVNSLAVSRNGLVLSGATDMGLHWWDLETRKPKHIIRGDSSSTGTCVALSPDGRFAATGKANGHLNFWDAQKGTLLWNYNASNKPIRALSFSPDGTKFVAAGDDQHARIWYSGNLNPPVHEMKHEAAVVSVAWSSDGLEMITATSNQRLQRWNATTGKLRPPHDQVPAPISSISLSPDDKSVLVGSTDGRIRLLSLAEGKITRTYQGHKESVAAVRFLPSGRHFVSGSLDTTIRLWSVTGTEVARKEMPQRSTHCLAVSPDGRHVITGVGQADDAVIWVLRLPESVWPDSDERVGEK